MSRAQRLRLTTSEYTAQLERELEKRTIESRNQGVRAPFHECLRIVCTPEKGMAIVSQKHIAKGTRIQPPGVIWYIKNENSETANINYLTEYDNFRQRHADNEQILQTIGTLQSHTTNQTRLTQHSLRKMFQVNGWRHRSGTVVSVVAGSFFNHSCNPDFSADIRLKSDKMYVTAIRDIVQGREVFVSYLGKKQLNAKVQHREESLTSWGFFCECPKCLSDTADLHTLAETDDAAARAAVIRLKYLRDSMSPIVIGDDVDKFVKIEPRDDELASLPVGSEDTIIIIDDSSDEEEEDTESAQAGARQRTHTKQSGPQIQASSHTEDADFQRCEIQRDHALLQISHKNINAFQDSGSADYVPPVPPTLLPQQTILHVPPVRLVPFKFLTVAVVEAEARARSMMIPVVEDVAILEDNTNSLGKQMCACKSGKLFKDCHQFLVNKSHSNPP